MNSRNIPFRIEDFDVLATSIGADETFFIFKELKFSFDVGKCPRHVVLAENILLTHLHMDHAAGLPYYISTRGLYNLKPGRIFALRSEAPKIDRLMKVWQEMEHCRYKYELVPVDPFEKVFMSKDLLFQPFPVHHRIPCIGYTVYRQVKKLKKEFLGLNGPQIVELKKNGVEIVNTTHVPLVSFLGDTNGKIFSNPESMAIFKESRLLIVEATFLAEGEEKLAYQRGHIHLQDIKNALPDLNNKHILLTHFSQRYPENFVLKMVKHYFSEEERSRITPLCPRVLSTPDFPEVPNEIDPLFEHETGEISR